jgi:hypothetical protein
MLLHESGIMNNVLLPILLIIVQRCYTRFGLNNIFQYVVDNYKQCGQQIII